MTAPHDPIQDSLDPRPAAARWFARTRSGAMNKRERSAFQAWLDASPEHAAAYGHVSRLWDEAEEIHDDAQILALREKALARHPARAGHRRWWGAFAVCAGVAAAAGLTVIAVVVVQGHPPERLFRTGVGQTGSIALMDGSIMTLDTDTTARARISGRRRVIYLDHGRAFFKVAKDRARPFIVHADGKSVTATGTQFEVTSEPHRFEVLLVEGHVRVSAPKAGDGNGQALSTDLDPGTRLSDTNAGGWTLTRIDNSRNQLAWMEGQLLFDNKPLSEIVRQMNRYSHRKIVLDDAAIANRPIYGAFMAGDVEQFVRALEDYRIVRIKSQNEDIIVLTAP